MGITAIWEKIIFSGSLQKELSIGFKANLIHHSKNESYIFRGIGVALEHDFMQGNQKGLDVLGSDAFTERLIVEKNSVGFMRISTEDLVYAVADFYELSKNSLSSTKRDRIHVEARSVLSFIVRETTGATLTELVTFLNRKVNTLSEFAKKLEISLLGNPEIKLVVEKIQRIIGADIGS